jgi:hypothetical protein
LFHSAVGPQDINDVILSVTEAARTKDGVVIRHWKIPFSVSKPGRRIEKPGMVAAGLIANILT